MSKKVEAAAVEPELVHAEYHDLAEPTVEVGVSDTFVVRNEELPPVRPSGESVPASNAGPPPEVVLSYQEQADPAYHNQVALDSWNDLQAQKAAKAAEDAAYLAGPVA